MRCLSVYLLLISVFTANLSSTESFGGSSGDDSKVYIVYLGHLSRPDSSDEHQDYTAVEAAHHDLLNQVLHDGSYASDRILRSYKRSLNGFAAKLSEEEAHQLSGMNGVVSVFPSRTLKLLTTRSWDFLGFPQTPSEELRLEGDVIIGVLDTGIWPDSPSFSDEGFGPPPSRWKGTCHHHFTCNKYEKIYQYNGDYGETYSKIIGARAYNRGSSSSSLSPLDDDGHGSHTASTVAGNAVANVSFYGLANGTARGAVPGARLAIYKVCCDDADILAGFDDAIADGVDVISISIGGLLPFDYFSDVIAIGSFHAMRRGVLTSAAAGDAASDPEGHVCNVAPWMLSVAASSIDRRFIDKIVLGNGNTIVGTSINSFQTVTNATLAFPAHGYCDSDNLAGGSYRSKIVLCPATQDGVPNFGEGPLLAGAAGVVTVDSETDNAFAFPLPGLTVSQEHFDQIMAYVNSTSNPAGTIDRTEVTANPQAPVVASFSSPGPNMITPGILKPDLSAPGIDIIASWSPLASPTYIPKDTRKVQYNIMSGTSMACPHASGAAAYVKSFHHDWSPAMIMSALITTATPMNTPGNSDSNALNYGAGQLNPVNARNPGLVYDASESDYVAMLCTQGYNATQLTLVTGSNTTACANGTKPGSGSDLNYPTMAAPVDPGKNFTVGFPRTVTNVGAVNTMYNVKILFPDEAADLMVDVSPTRLEFSAQNQKVSFTVTVSGVALQEGKVSSATVVWYNNEHEVRSPVVVYAMHFKGKGV